MGRPKAFEAIGGGDTLLSRVVARLQPVCGEIIIVARQDQVKELTLSRLPAQIVTDIVTDRGPLGGIYSGLEHSKSEVNFAVACDMPFINARLMNFMIGLVNGWDIVAPQTNGLTEQLHTVYSKK